MLQRLLNVGVFLGLTVIVFSCEHKPKNEIGPDNNTAADSSNCHPDTVYFVNSILPLINTTCAQDGCHDSATQKAELRLDNYNAIMSKGKIIPGNPNDGDFMEVIRSTDPGKRMPPPPASPLSQDQINMIAKWIQQGAKNNSCKKACDTSIYTYSGAIAGIISNNCVSCHKTGTVLLNSYQGVKAVADNGKLWGSINHMPGYRPMPGPQIYISDCDRTKIRKWLDMGAPNN